MASSVALVRISLLVHNYGSTRSVRLSHQSPANKSRKNYTATYEKR